MNYQVKIEMDKREFIDLEQRYKKAKAWFYFYERFIDFKLGRKKYTNNDIDELIIYYEYKEQYKLCEKLLNMKK